MMIVYHIVAWNSTGAPGEGKGESKNKSRTERVIESSVGRQRRGEAGRNVREVAAAGLSGRSLAGPVVPLSSPCPPSSPLCHPNIPPPTLASPLTPHTPHTAAALRPPSPSSAVPPLGNLTARMLV